MRVTEATKNATRKRILAVAQKQFAEHGFEATTTRNVARSAKIAAGTLFNYFPTKESIVASLVGDASHRVTEEYAGKSREESKRTVESLSMEEELFGYVAALLARLKPYRKYLPAALETSLSPLAIDGTGETASLRADHLETVGQILSRHSDDEAPSSTALQLYWSLYTGVLAFSAQDTSPRQEDTLALRRRVAIDVRRLAECKQFRKTNSEIEQGFAKRKVIPCHLLQSLSLHCPNRLNFPSRNCKRR